MKRLLRFRRSTVVIACVSFSAGFLSFAAAAQTYPVKPVRIVIPIAAGGGTDIVGRMIAQKLSESMGQQFIVDNRPGAGGIIGTEAVAKAPPDGYTVLLTPTSHTINPSVYSKLPYDTVKDFAPVALLVSVTTVFVTHPSLPVRTVKDVAALAKAQPGQLSFGSAGNGHLFHLTGELFKTTAKIDMVHVPYKGGAPAIASLVGGEVSLLFETMLALQPFIEAKRVRPLAVASAQRSPLLPAVPTFAESGYPGIVASNWYAMFAPASTPRAVITRLNTEITRVLAAPDMRDRLRAQGTEVVTGSPEQLGEFVNSELAKWSQAAKASGARVD
jgi:tripartite-type tricarboxylate transporter receptor subunit TctC